MTARPTARPIATPLARPIAGAGDGGASTALLLDTYTGSSAAFSLQKIRSAYNGACVRVRRSSDNAEQDIGFTETNLDTTSLLSFCGAGNGFVTTWYSQEGSNNATQSTTTAQPQIVSSGSVMTDGGLPCITFDNSWFSLASSIDATTWTVSGVSRRSVSSGQTLILFARSTGLFASYLNWNDGLCYVIDVAGIKTGTSNSARELIVSQDQVAADKTIRRNGSALTLTTGSASSGSAIFDRLGCNPSSNSFGTMQEVICWPNQSANVAAIETNINSRWGVY